MWILWCMNWNHWKVLKIEMNSILQRIEWYKHLDLLLLLTKKCLACPNVLRWHNIWMHLIKCFLYVCSWIKFLHFLTNLEKQFYVLPFNNKYRHKLWSTNTFIPFQRKEPKYLVYSRVNYLLYHLPPSHVQLIKLILLLQKMGIRQIRIRNIRKTHNKRTV